MSRLPGGRLLVTGGFMRRQPGVTDTPSDDPTALRTIGNAETMLLSPPSDPSMPDVVMCGASTDAGVRDAGPADASDLDAGAPDADTVDADVADPDAAMEPEPDPPSDG